MTKQENATKPSSNGGFLFVLTYTYSLWYTPRVNKRIGAYMKVLILMFMAVLLTNPLSNQLLVILFEQFIFLISPAAPYTMGVFAASVVFYMGMKYTEMSKVKLPKKSKKTSKDGMKFELSK